MMAFIPVMTYLEEMLLCVWDIPKMLFMWAAVCRWTVMTLADVMVENEVTDTEVEGSKCHIAGFISPLFWVYMNT